MATFNDPNIAANVAQVGMGAGTVWTPYHATSGPLPVGTGGAYRLSMVSQTIAASFAANAELFQFRYITSNSRVCLVHGISVSAAMLTPPAVGVVASVLTLMATVARSWTVAGSLGTRAVLTGNNQKLRVAGHATSEVNDAGMNTTLAAGLTSGTRTLDSQAIGSVVSSMYFDIAAGDVSGVLIPKTNLMGEFLAGMAFPLILANQEGFVVKNGAVAWPATMTWVGTVDVAWSEVQSF